MKIHLVDGTYELFRHFYGQRRFNQGKDAPFGAVIGVLNGVMVVTKLEFKSRDDDDDGDDDDVSGGSQEFEFKGAAACVSCGATSGTFTVKGVTVSYDADTEFEDGLSGSTLDGKTVYLVDCRFDDSDVFLRQMEAWFAEHLPGVRTVVN